MKKTTLTILLCAALLLSACNKVPSNDDNSGSHGSNSDNTSVDISDIDYTISSEELYMNIYNKTVRYEDAPLYSAFQNDVVRKINESANLNVVWNDVMVFTRDNPSQEMYPYSIFVPTNLGYNVVMEAAVSSFSDNGIVSHILSWSDVYRVYGKYSLNDELISVNDSKTINKTQLTEALAGLNKYSDYTINYAGLRLDENVLFVPLRKEGEVVAVQIAIGDDFSYSLLSALPIDTTELSTYEFIVKYNCFGFTPMELVKYDTFDQLNPRSAILNYYRDYGVIDEATVYSEFMPTTYVRIKYNDTDVTFQLIDTQTGTAISVSDITDEAMCDRLIWRPTNTEDTPDVDIVSPQGYVFPKGFVFPVTDGSTSTTNLDKAVRTAILGGEQIVAHTKTYLACDNLIKGKCEMIFTTPLSEDQLRLMALYDFKHEAVPVAGEGFVFVVNKDNPVDTLTIEQLKKIYSGEITNWKDVGGNDAEILAYQRNADSGSQNYMISFMGDTPLMKPVTDIIPGTMSGVLDVVANYDNGINAIGYSVYAYSDGMYENISEIKYIKVNGVEPSLTTLSNGSYPLLGYNYAVFSASEPEDSNVRALVKWIQSDEGQQVIANAGYVPYRKVEGLTLPEPTTKTLYTATATSGIKQPEKTADHYYQCNIVPDTFVTAGLDEAIAAFISDAKRELAQVDKAEMQTFIKLRNAYVWWDEEVYIKTTLINGYLSVLVGLPYNLGYQDSPNYYYEARTAVFDIYTGERLELSDLFFDSVDFVPLLNQHIADEAATPYSGFATTHDMIRDFSGLYEGEFTFTAGSIIFDCDTCFADGVEISLAELSEYMVTSIPRDMTGYVYDDVPVYKKVLVTYETKTCYAEEKNGITIMYLDKSKAPVAAEVCDKINAFIDKTYETYFTAEKLLAEVENRGVSAEYVDIKPYAYFYVSIMGDRCINFGGGNLAIAQYSSVPCEFNVIDGQYNPYYFDYFFNAQTGEELRIGDLFSDGWQDGAEYYIYDDSFDRWDESTWTEYATELETNTCQVKGIVDYVMPPFKQGDLSDIEFPALVYLMAENGDWIVASVPREYIK